MAVSIVTAAYLKSDALFVSAAPSSPNWGTKARESKIISPFFDKASAQAEATRQAALLEGPLVEELVVVKGNRKDLHLKTITVTGDQLGADAGFVGFVVGVNELGGETELAVMRSLSP